ncbi:12114_t:CDS:2, partial [Dentiscutata erythropus]
YVAEVLRSHGIATFLLDLLTPQEEQVDGVTRHLRFNIAALLAAHERPNEVQMIISRGGRPDLVKPEILKEIPTPTLCIVGGNDLGVLNLNESALRNLGSQTKQLEIIPGATHLFEEPGCLEKVADLAAQWIKQNLTNDHEKN